MREGEPQGIQGCRVLDGKRDDPEDDVEVDADTVCLRVCVAGPRASRSSLGEPRGAAMTLKGPFGTMRPSERTAEQMTNADEGREEGLQPGPLESWVVLGDSLTEGVGFHRHSYVTELVHMLRRDGAGCAPAAGAAITLVRLRGAGAGGASRWVRFSHVADFDEEESGCERGIWIWNLACEGTTIESDHRLINLVRLLQPAVTVVFRGSLESILRPRSITSGVWPGYVPRSWRGLAGMDPRCYFSSQRVRRNKQVVVDAAKQWMRHRLLASEGAEPLLSVGVIGNHARGLF